MKKIIVIITLLLIILTSCDTVHYDLFNGKGMDYVIISSDKKMIDPFDEKYLYVDKIQKQKYIQEIENKYNINIVFDDLVLKGENTFKNANVYYGTHNNYSVYATRGLNDYSIKEWFVPLHDYKSSQSLILNKNAEYEDDKLELATVFNKVYMFYPGDLYSYNFLYYDSFLDLGVLDPQILYENNNWNIEQYKYLLLNYLNNDVNIEKTYLNKNYINTENELLAFATTPADLAAGILSANGLNFLNRDNLDPSDSKKQKIINEIESLFFDYYGYNPSNLNHVSSSFMLDFKNISIASPLACDNTLVSADYSDLLNISSGCNNSFKPAGLLKIVPYPSEDYNKYTSYTDSYSQYGYALINDESLYNNNFTKEVSFDILYDLTEGYYKKYPNVQENIIRQNLSQVLTDHSVELFFKLNKKVSVEMIGSLQDLFVFDKGCYLNQYFECKSFNYYLIADPKYNSYAFMRNFNNDSETTYAARNFYSKFNYDVAFLGLTEPVKYINISEYYINEYKKFIRN